MNLFFSFHLFEWAFLPINITIFDAQIVEKKIYISLVELFYWLDLFFVLQPLSDLRINNENESPQVLAHGKPI